MALFFDYSNQYDYSGRWAVSQPNHQIRAGARTRSTEAPEKGLARRGGVGGLDRRIVDAKPCQHLPGVGAPRHGEFALREGASFSSGGGEGLALGSRPVVDRRPRRRDFLAPSGENC
jgi:hypothetical protein